MTWVTWRQHRIEAAIIVIVVLLTAILLLVTGPGVPIAHGPVSPEARLQFHDTGQ